MPALGAKSAYSLQHSDRSSSILLSAKITLPPFRLPSGDGRMVRTNFDFDALVVRGKGMLDPAVYRAIAETAACAAGDVIEVGTGRGASAIAAAVAGRTGG